MSQTYTISGQIVTTNNNVRNIVTLADSTSTTGSNVICNSQNVVTGSWQTLNSGSNSNLRFLYLSNSDTTSSLVVAMNSTTVSSSVLLPGDFCVYTYNGPCTVYVQASGSHSPVLAQYIYVSA